MRVLLAAVLSLAAVLGAAAPAAAQARSEPFNSGHVEAQLIAQDAGVVPGSTVILGLRQKITEGWHTYWRNPGDSGEATKLLWTLPAGWTAGEIVWPAPHRLPLGPLVNYGFSDGVILPVSVQAPASARPGETVTLKAAVTYLVCKDVCIPEGAQLQIDVPVVAAPAGADPKWGAELIKTVADAPKPAGLNATFQTAADSLKLSVTGGPLAGADMSGAYFYPYNGAVIDHAGPQAIERGPQGLTLTVKPSVALAMGTAPTMIDGVLVLPGGAYELTANTGPLQPAAAGLGPPPAAAGSSGEGGGSGGAPLGLIAAAAFAFIGGLILNLMPCVFPVLSMKAASLASHADDRRATQAQGLAFMAGVLVTFLILGGLLIAVRAAGETVGWGFQLQSPAVVAALGLIMLLTALNLSGVFEIGTSVQSVGSGLASKGGLAGAAFTGALAVVVAAPCTAPFMAPALGFALTQSPAAAMTVFLALGLGMAAPFTALAFIPALLKLIPRPGAWMDTFRKVLAFPMYAAAAWLAWVLAQQTDSGGLARLLAAAVLVAFAAWLYGRGQSPENSKAKHWGLTASGAAGVAVSVIAAVALPYAPVASAASGATVTAARRLEHEPYSPERLAELRSADIPVFVDFTAAWCVTCKVNEKTTLSTAKVADAFQNTGAVYMVGDWTNQNPQIAAILSRYGRAGVPLYLVYGAGGKEAVVMPQFLTVGAVVAALEAAAA